MELLIYKSKMAWLYFEVWTLLTHKSSHSCISDCCRRMYPLRSFSGVVYAYSSCVLLAATQGCMAGLCWCLSHTGPGMTCPHTASHQVSVWREHITRSKEFSCDVYIQIYSVIFVYVGGWPWFIQCVHSPLVSTCNLQFFNTKVNYSTWSSNNKSRWRRHMELPVWLNKCASILANIIIIFMFLILL